jgi:hypothetical protein
LKPGKNKDYSFEAGPLPTSFLPNIGHPEFFTTFDAHNVREKSGTIWDCFITGNRLTGNPGTGRMADNWLTGN